MRLKKNCDNKRLSLREYCVCVRERERERERESSFCAEYYSTPRERKNTRKPLAVWRFFFSVEEKERDLYTGLGFIFLSFRRRNFTTKVLKCKRGTERERERDFARETERER